MSASVVRRIQRNMLAVATGARYGNGGSKRRVQHGYRRDMGLAESLQHAQIRNHQMRVMRNLARMLKGLQGK